MNPNATSEQQEETQEQATPVETQEQATPVKTTGQYDGPLSREMREEMKALSKEIFGSSSKYQKLYEQTEIVTMKKKEIIPGENGAEDTEREVTVPVLVNGSKQSRVVRRNNAEVLELLKTFKARRDEFMAQMQKQQEEQKAKREAADKAAKLQEDLGGSAL